MAFFPWKEEYSVNIKSFDEQHKKLIGFLNELYEALDQGKGRDAIGNTLSGLIQYTKSHFSAEEGLMKMYNYPDYQKHKEIHDKMAGHVLGLQKKYKEGEIASPIQITNFLKDWLSKHILQTDKAYGPFLTEKGVS